MNPPPPSHLKRRSKTFWRTITEHYNLGPDHLEALRRLCECIDRADEARRIVDEEGIVVRDRYSNPKTHPAADLEVKLRAQIRGYLEALKLDQEGLPARMSAAALARKRWKGA